SDRDWSSDVCSSDLGTDAVAMGWQPTTGFTSFGNWIGYDEGMIIYCLGLGAATNPLPASAWSRWTSGYTWATNYGFAFVPFPPRSEERRVGKEGSSL